MPKQSFHWERVVHEESTSLSDNSKDYTATFIFLDQKDDQPTITKSMMPEAWVQSKCCWPGTEFLTSVFNLLYIQNNTSIIHT